ncbi:hypothetical protein HAZT_HAZT011347 [Hyalella azteca]|uniref:Sulfotransferase domain-containing protein n=1 Tax=Hyalella azteca TaxID=294128 RepID=A0A6A0GXW2_HYAAZ|nr:hypothetical protein HAZT_HAZT011347 [Hyalella azteca]
MNRDVQEPGLSREEIILAKTRSKIRAKFQNYGVHPSLGVADVAALVPEMGGRPALNWVVTTWRSGSTFVGDLLTAHPGTFYHYEPLMDFDIQQITTSRTEGLTLGSSVTTRCCGLPVPCAEVFVNNLNFFLGSVNSFLSKS